MLAAVSGGGSGGATPRRRMRIVVVMPEPPFAEGGPAGRCAAAVLQGLHADERIELSALAADRRATGRGSPPPGVPVEVVSLPPQGRLEAWSDLLRRPLGDLSRGEFGERVRTLAADADVLHLDQVQAAWCDLGSHVPSLVHLHYLVRLDRPGRPSGLREAVQLYGFAAAERAAIRRHTFLVANSPVVAAELRRRAPDADITVVPLVLDPELYGPAAGVPRVAGFIGQGVWPNTAAAARRLVGGVWPLVRRELPDARLLVAGRGMAELGLPVTEGVEMLGEVDSAGEFLRNLSLLVFPAVGGTGMKVKVLEALACGLPVVTTPSGAEGLAPSDGVVVADDDAALARAAASLLRDDEERKQRGAAALVTFREQHTPAVAATTFADLYARMVERR
jgi:glycosyltransferase involved in cell wall biosynthesis